jgi:hypothetical protein
MLLPEKDSSNAYVIRTDFSSEDRWSQIAGEIRGAMSAIEIDVCFIEDRTYENASEEEILPALIGNDFHTFAFIVDRVSIESRESIVLVMDLFDEPGRTFRVIPDAMLSIQANLHLANMDFEDYADSTDLDGVFRGFES